MLAVAFVVLVHAFHYIKPALASARIATVTPAYRNTCSRLRVFLVAAFLAKQVTFVARVLTAFNAHAVRVD
jgi:hypothetical protein